MLESLKFARLRVAPVECRTRLLLDPFLCVGPGSEVHADTLFNISQQCAALGIMLCVERQAWLEASRDPDVMRRRVDLSRFEPIVKLDPLPTPTERDAGALFIPARSETDIADLKLLGALQARVVDHLVALDGRIHALAAHAGFGPRVLTPADALAWLHSLAGDVRPVVLRELDPRSMAQQPRLDRLLQDECEPFDPYLRGRLAAGHGRVLATMAGDEPLAFGVAESAADGTRLELTALAASEPARGARALEPIVAATLAMARRRGVQLAALLPPHDEMPLHLLEELGFVRGEVDPHGRVQLLHIAEPMVPQPAAGQAVWLLPLDATAHDDLLPELSGASQAQLFAVGSDSRPQTLGSPLRKQIILPVLARPPSRGDLLLLFHGRASRRQASASVTCAMRIDRVEDCVMLEDVLALNASRPGCSLPTIQARLANGPVSVLDVAMLGRLERFLPLSWLKEHGVLGAAPRGLKRLDDDAWQRLERRLALA